MSKILIVEDEEAIADLEKDYLELSGFDVEIENDGTSGMERALNEDFDMFILDLMLPGTDGYFRMTKYIVVPVFSLLVAQIFPPWSSMIFFTIDRPIPLPPVEEFLEESVR